MKQIRRTTEGQVGDGWREGPESGKVTGRWNGNAVRRERGIERGAGTL
jgi:hypothetical protein